MVRYQNSNGIICDLQSANIKIKDTKLHSYSWKVSGNNQKFGVLVDHFEKDPLAFKMELKISGTENEKKEIANKLCDIFDYDVRENKPGKLFFDEYYIECYITDSETAPGDYFDVKKTINFYCPYPFWIKETFYQFRPQQIPVKEPDIQYPVISGGTYSEKALENKAVLGEFPFDMARPSNIKITYPMFGFPFDFAATNYGRRTINNPSFTDSNFILTIYGFADNPSIMIAGHPYTVYATIYEGERMVINSVDRTVLKIGRMGEVTSLYNSREKNISVFQKIPPGAHVVTWPGSYGIDLTLLDERSEPKWSF